MKFLIMIILSPVFLWNILEFIKTKYWLLLLHAFIIVMAAYISYVQVETSEGFEKRLLKYIRGDRRE